MGFAENLIAFLDKENLTQREFAQMIGVSHGLVRHWTTGKHVPPLKTIEKICQHFNVSVTQFLSQGSNLNNVLREVSDGYGREAADRKRYAAWLEDLRRGWQKRSDSDRSIAREAIRSLFPSTHADVIKWVESQR